MTSALDSLLLVARLGLAAVFAVAAVSKLTDLPGARRTLVDFGVPAALAAAGAVVLAAAELLAAGLLIPTVTARWGALLALGLLVVFAVAISRSLARGERPDCNCFGAVHSAPVGPLTLARNIALGALAALVAATGPGESLGSLDSTTVLAVAGVLAAALLLGVTWFSWQLFKQNGRLLARVRALEEETGASRPEPPQTGGLAQGEAIPELSLETPGGSARSLSELAAQPSPIALVFSDPACRGCREVMSRLPALKAELDGVVEPILVTRGAGPDADAAADRGLEVLIQEDREALVAFQVGAIPAAVIVRDGRIASATAIGEEAIDSLLRSVAEIPLPDLQVIATSGAAR